MPVGDDYLLVMHAYTFPCISFQYLQKLFRGPIENLIASPEDLEVDPSRLTPQTPSSAASDGSCSSQSDLETSTLQRNQTALANLVRLVWQRLQASLEYFPT